MKRFLVSLLAGSMLMIAATSAFAQAAGPRGGGQGGPPRGGVNGGTWRTGDPAELQKIEARVINSLGLTAAQKNAVAAADKKRADALAKLRKQYEGKDIGKMPEADRKKAMASFQKVNSDHQAAVKKAMGDKKYAEFQKKHNAEVQKYMQQLGDKMRKEMEARRKATQTKIMNELKLTTAQKNAVAAADKKHDAAVAALNKQYAGKTSDADRKKMSASFQKIRTERDAAYKKAMGSKYAEYQKKMEAERQKMRGPGGGGRPAASGRTKA